MSKKQKYHSQRLELNGASANEHEVTINRLRGFLLTLFVIGLSGAGGELLLLGHTEDFRQWIPLTLMSFSVIVLGWHGIARRRTSLRIFQITMLLFVASGFVGMLLHYRANVEFELEMYPAMKGFALFWKAIKGAAPPTLAPGTMIQLGLLGLAYTYRHPVLIESTEEKSIRI